MATRGGVGLAAKINIIATPETYYRNLAFGNLANLASCAVSGLIFLTGWRQPFDFLLLTWKTTWPIPSLHHWFSAFALVVTGAVYSFSKKLPARRSILGITLLCLFFLMGGGLLINQSLPLIGELFRSPFTKFSTVLSFGYAAFFAIGAIFVLDLFSFLHSRLTYYLTLFTVTLALVIFMTPAFTGGLISPTMRLKLPAEYGQLFDFFKNQDPATRIANFPQYTFWGWNYYSWGYRGSGFLWYGIRQPILDRAFDVWERSGEKYYQEISTALFSEDRAEFERLIDKYAVNWILVDKNVISPNANQDLGNEKLLAVLTTSPKFTLAENINNKILIYKTDIDRKVKNFLSTSGPAEPLSQPFADLSLRPLALHSLGEGGFAQITNDTVTLTAKGEGALYLPSYTQTENLIPTTVAYRKTPTGLQLKFTPRLPEIKVDRKIVSPTATPIFLDFALPENSSGLILGLNDQYLEVQLPDELSIQSSFYPLTNLYLPSRETSRVSLYANVPAYKLDLTTPLSGATLAQCYTDKPNRKIEKIVAAKTISLFGTDLVGCLSAPIPMAGVDQLISLEFTYHSATGTPANANITNATYGGTNSPQPLLAKKSPTFTRLFAKPLQGQALQANLSWRPTNPNPPRSHLPKCLRLATCPPWRNRFYPQPHSAMQVPNLQARQVRNLSISIPLLDTPYTVAATAENLNSEARNCDNFNQGDFSRSITADGFLYSAKNANSCDQLNLKHLAHQTNYAIIIDAQNQRGLFPTVCLENHATRRCDVFERLVNGQQIILQPIANSNELPGYTLHLFNQSFGNRPTENLIKSISVVPFPLSFLKKISFSSASDSSGVAGTDSREVARITNSTHPAEFLYTANISWDGGRSEAKDSSQVISLYQTYSPYWKALLVSEEDLKLPTWLLIAKLPFLYLNKPVILANAGIYTEWYNSWELPAGENRLVIFYLPQYLEFLGFLLLTPFLAVPVYILFIRKAPPKK